jgi:hypothetical protein
MAKAKSKRVLWATTYHGPARIDIYKKYDERWQQNHHAETTMLKSVQNNCEIDINPDFFDSPVFFNEILLHEFTHCLEAIYPAAAFSPRRVNGCSALAKTIGAGLGEMLTKLKQVAGKGGR